MSDIILVNASIARKNKDNDFTGDNLFEGKVSILNVPVHATNADAIFAGLVAGDLYRTGGDPDILCIVH